MSIQLPTVFRRIHRATEPSQYHPWRNNCKHGYDQPSSQPQGSVLNTEQVDLGGSLAVASRGLYATGVSTDLNGW